VFDGFALDRIDVGEAVLRVRHGGGGPPVLLLHRHPRTRATWHRVAPLLARRHAVVCPDLRGYGESSKPPTTPDHEPYSKRALARDCVRLMRALGHERFAVVGHDRGAYIAFRAALARCDARFAAAWWHWFFLGQTDNPAERVISADPEAWYRPDRGLMGEENYEDPARELCGNPLALWRTWADDLRGGPIESGHHIAEEAAEALVAELDRFLG
jgi:haloacetate dehalogenase